MLMKKISLLLMSLLALSSCEQEELSDFVKDDVNSLQTRTVSSIADFNPIDELADIPVNILNVGNTSRRYLSCVKSGTKVDLSTKDDGSLRQRWYVKSGNIFLVGGNSSLTLPSGSKIAVCFPIPDCSYPFLAGLSFPSPMMHGFTLSGNSYYIRNVNPIFGSPGKYGRYLQSNSQTGSDLSYKDTNPGKLALWDICPVGEYELVDLQYVRTTVDNFTPTELICDRDSYDNPSSGVATWNYSVSVKYTETSNFSKTEGVSVSVSNGLNVGLPSASGNPSIGINTTIQQQASKSWTYGTSDTKEITKSRTANIQVPPHTNIRLEAVLFLYEGTVTYVATLRKIGDTKTFKVKGKWRGTSFSEFKAKTYDASTGKLLNTSNFNE